MDKKNNGKLDTAKVSEAYAKLRKKLSSSSYNGEVKAEEKEAVTVKAEDGSVNVPDFAADNEETVKVLLNADGDKSVSVEEKTPVEEKNEVKDRKSSYELDSYDGILSKRKSSTDEKKKKKYNSYFDDEPLFIFDSFVEDEPVKENEVQADVETTEIVETAEVVEAAEVVEDM